MRKPMWAVVGVLVLAMTLVVACSEDGNDSNDAPTEFGQAAQDGEESVPSTAGGGSASGDDGGAARADLDSPFAPGAAPEPGDTGVDESAGDNALGPVTLQQLSDGRVIIYTSWMVVEVDDVPAAAQQARTAIAGLGGLVFGEETTTEPIARTVLTFKVAPEDFQEALQRLADLGDLESQQISTDDVTERVVDLESRITTAEASVERLREFLSNATDLEGIAQIEAQLLIRETDLERLRGQLRTLQEQAALATIYVTLTEPQPDDPEAAVELVQTGYLGSDAGERCPGDDELEIDEGETFTVCFEIENTGNLAMTEIEVRDPGLDLDEKDFQVLEGSLDNLEPEERLVGYFELDAELGRFPSPRFSAVPVDEDGDPMRIGISVDEERLDLQVIEDTSVASFGEGFSNSVGALKTLGEVGVLAIAVLIPFLWVPLIVLAIVWLVRRNTSRRLPPPAPASVTTSEGDTGD